MRDMIRALFVLLGLAACAGPQGGAADLEVGVATADITPPVGYRLGGYFKDRFAKEVRDPLQAKALVLRQGEIRAAFVLCDLVGVPAWIADGARKTAQNRTGIPAGHIAVAATHTHTGPFLPAAQTMDPYLSSLINALADAITRANAALKPARLEGGAVAQSPPLSFNRRHRFKDGKIRTIGPVTRHLPDHEPENIAESAGPIDPDVGLLRVLDAGGGLRAVLTVFALHLNTVGDTTQGEPLVSADFAGVLARELGVLSLFGAGTCGDINYVDPKTPGTRSTEEIGKLLAATVKGATLRPLRPSLAVKSARFEVPVHRFPPERVEQARKDLARKTEIPFYTLVESTAVLDLERRAGKPYPVEVQAFRIDPETAIVTLPGEVFVELGLAIKRGSPFKTTHVIELANDNGVAYIPTKKAFEESGYEVLHSRLAAGSGERIVEEALRLLHELD